MKNNLQRLLGIGTVYKIRRERPFEEIDRNLKMIRDHGFSTVTFWPAITWWDDPKLKEPSCETILRLLEKADHYGLGAIVEITGQNPSYEIVPDFQLKPEYLTEDDIGFSNEINFNHPEVKKIASANLGFLVKQLKDCPALLAYDAWNETYFHSRDKYTESLFHQWLKEKYGNDITILNEAWETTFRDFSQISITRKYFGASGWASLCPGFDWEKFRTDNLAGILREWVAIIKKHDPHHPVMADNGECSVFNHSLTGGNCDWKVAAEVDIFGTTYYPRSSCGHYLGRDDKIMQNGDFWAIECALNATRSAADGKPWVISELQTHTRNSLKPSTYVDQEHLQLWLWQAIALGCQSITFWKWHPFIRGKQSSGRGLTAINGESTDRLSAVAKIAEKFNNNLSIFKALKNDRKEAAIIYNHTVISLMNLQVTEDTKYYQKSLAGWSKLIWEKSWHQDYLECNNLTEDKLSKYKIVVAPGTMVINPEILSTIRRYVNNGGVFIADGRFALMNENNYVYNNVPGGDNGDLTGYRELDIRPVADDCKTVTVGSYEFENKSLFHCIIHAENNANCIGRFNDGDSAIVVQKFGKGAFIYCAFDLGYTYYHGFNASVSKAFNEIVKEYDRSFSIRAIDGNRKISRHVYQVPEGLLVFIINYDDNDALAEFDYDTGGIKYENIRVVEGKEPEVSYNKEYIRIRKFMQSNEISVTFLTDR